MLIDTHCHLNMMVKKTFDTPLTSNECQHAQKIITEAEDAGVSSIICIGTNIIESKNCIMLAQKYKNVFASIGLHPTDIKENWRNELLELKELLNKKDAYKIVGIGECGIDKYHPTYNLVWQQEVFTAQIEMALEYDVALVIHSREAAKETLECLAPYSKNSLRAIMHCYSYDLEIASEIITHGYKLGIGGTITYPKNEMLRSVVKEVGLSEIVLETDAPFLPPQIIRGKQNTPAQIYTIAEYIASLKQTNLTEVALATSTNAKSIFKL